LSVTLCAILLFISLYPSYLSALNLFSIRAGNINFCSRSISESIYKVSNFFFPSYFTRCPPVSYLFYTLALLVIVSYVLDLPYRKQLLLLACVSLTLHLFLLFSIHFFSLVLHLGVLSSVSRLYSLFFTLTSMITTCLLFRYAHSLRRQKIPFTEACVLTLLFVILGQPTFNPWYFIWILPLVILLEDRTISLYLLVFLSLLQPLLYYGPPVFFKGLVP